MTKIYLNCMIHGKQEVEELTLINPTKAILKCKCVYCIHIWGNIYLEKYPICSRCKVSFDPSEHNWKSQELYILKDNTYICEDCLKPDEEVRKRKIYTINST